MRCPVNSGRATAAKTPPAHKPTASMSWSARRLRQEPFVSAQRGNFHLAGHLRTGARTPHFLKSLKVRKNLFNRLISKARGAMPSEQRERQNDPLRPYVQALWPAKSISLSKCPVFPNLRHDDLDMDTFTARLQGAEGATHGKQHTTTRSTERLTDTRFPTIKTSVACVMSSLSDETMMLTLVGAETTPRALTRARPGFCASVEWRRDAGVLGALSPTHSGVFGPPPLFVLMQSTLVREYLLFVAVRPHSLWVASPGSESSPRGRFLGRRPCSRSAIARGR